MGWNSWNTFGPNVNEQIVRETADAMVEHGFREAGYDYVVIDDCWQARKRGASGRLEADPEAFPSGIAALSDYVHERGLKFGIYSCAGTLTCAKRPGSYGYEAIDAKTFAEWGCDFLKYDCCYKPVDLESRVLYGRMAQALREAGRPMVFSMCNWGQHGLLDWAGQTGAQLWRMGPDIMDSWESVEQIAFEMQDSLERFSGPGRWNDPDMLVVGMNNTGHVARGGCNQTEYHTHFAMWCLLAAPLMIGCDVRSLDETSTSLLLQRELIAINQDPLGAQGYRLGKDEAEGEVWCKPLHDGSVAVGLVNRHDKDRRMVGVTWESVGIGPARTLQVRDISRGINLGAHKHAITTDVPPHGCKVLRLAP